MAASQVDSNLTSDLFGLIPPLEILEQIETLPRHCLAVMTKYLTSLKDPNRPSVGFNDIVEIECVVDYIHAELNTGHWSAVPVFLRQSFTLITFIKVLALSLYEQNVAVDPEKRECLMGYVDIGLLLGAPLERHENLLTAAASVLRKRARRDEKSNVPLKGADISDKIEKYKSIAGAELKTLSRPSIETFGADHFTARLPVKLSNCIAEWPALKKWNDLGYLMRVAGDRTVPVELGSHYLDEGWSQRLMTVREFVERYFDCADDDRTRGYLAQHNLFDQIPELREDISIPDYCCLTEDDDSSVEPDINAWFGPGGTVSPLHTDPKHNLLTQVFGTKQVLMFSPSDDAYLYPHDEQMLNNTSRVDPLEPDARLYPHFAKATMFKCLLAPGEMLYIPPKWWHHVVALDKSFSVSFWWT